MGEVVPPILTAEAVDSIRRGDGTYSVAASLIREILDSHEALRDDRDLWAATARHRETERDDNYQVWATRAFTAEARAAGLEAVVAAIVDSFGPSTRVSPELIDAARAVLEADRG